jgi:hypothetical protein
MEVSGSPSRPGRFTPGDRVPGTHWTEGWVHPRCSMDAVEKRRIYCHCQMSNRNSPAVQPVARRHAD